MERRRAIRTGSEPRSEERGGGLPRPSGSATSLLTLRTLHHNYPRSFPSTLHQMVEYPPFGCVSVEVLLQVATGGFYRLYKLHDVHAVVVSRLAELEGTASAEANKDAGGDAALHAGWIHNVKRWMSIRRTSKITDSHWQRARVCNNGGLFPATVKTAARSGCSVHLMVRRHHHSLALPIEANHNELSVGGASANATRTA